MIINMTSGGVMPDRILDAQTITPGTANQVIEEGTYLRGALTIAGDADLIPSNIPADVNLFGVQGKRPPNYGANVWKKYSVEEVQDSLTLTGVGYRPVIIQIRGSYLDYTKLTADDLVGLTGQYQQSGYVDWYNFTIISNSQIQLNGGSKFNYTYDAAYGYIRVSVEFSSAVTWRTSATLPAEKKTLLNFTVDDNPVAYPNGGTHTDNCYYELLAAVSSANVMALSDGAIATVQQDYRDQIETEVSNA